MRGSIPRRSATAGRAGIAACPAPFVRVIKHVRGETTLKAADATATLGGYLRGMEQLVSHLDKYDQRF